MANASMSLIDFGKTRYDKSEMMQTETQVGAPLVAYYIIYGIGNE